jgi:type II secretory pathway pseudopilin PulG
MKRQQHGFSLVEVAVGLAVSGAIGLVAWRMVPVSRGVAGGDPVSQQLQQAQEAIEGFALLRNRLPCPAATAGNGQEACAVTGVGELPWRTLGLARGDSALRYGVYRSGGADLALALNTFTPTLPVIAAASYPVGYNPNMVNGLDLCQTLRTAAGSPAAAPAGLHADTVPVAYALAHPGVNGVFEGANASAPALASFALTGQPLAPTFDDQTVAVGLPELSTRLGCPTRLGEASASARSAFAAYDLDRDAQMFLDFRDFVSQVRTTNRQLAVSSVGIASADLAVAIGAAATSLSLAANSVGIGTGNVVAAVGGVAAATAAVTAAGVLLTLAIKAEALAQRQDTSALLLKVQSKLDYNAAFLAATVVDRKGLLP